MILKPSDFIGEYSIPNLDDTMIDSNILGNTSLLNAIISKHEKKILIDILGFNLYNLLIDEIDLNNENRLKDTSDNKWNLLLNGNDCYVGIIKSIIPFIYYEFLKVKESQLTSLGVSKSQGKSSSDFSSRTKAVDAINDYNELVFGSSDYDYDVMQWGDLISINNSSNSKCSLINFLELNKNSYSEWIKPDFNKYKNVNTFDL